MKGKMPRYYCGSPQRISKTICTTCPKKALKCFMHYILGEVPDVIAWKSSCDTTEASVKHAGKSLSFFCIKEPR